MNKFKVSTTAPIVVILIILFVIVFLVYVTSSREGFEDYNLDYNTQYEN